MEGCQSRSSCVDAAQKHIASSPRKRIALIPAFAGFSNGCGLPGLTILTEDWELIFIPQTDSNNSSYKVITYGINDKMSLRVPPYSVLFSHIGLNRLKDKY